MKELRQWHCVQDDQFVLHDAGHVDDAQSDSVQTPSILSAQVQVNDPQSALALAHDQQHSLDIQPAPDKLADADVVKQKPPDPPDNNMVPRRSKRSCKRRYVCLNLSTL